MSSLESPSSLHLSGSTDWLGRLVNRHPSFWIRLGNLESRVLAPDLQDISITSPVYVCGLARSGSTMLLEILAAHEDTVSHRYEDFPFLFTPYWWRLLLSVTPRRHQMKERAHGDGILVSSKSPEAMEEILWMAFFEELHRTNSSAVLDERTNNPAFEPFYRDHIRKLLLHCKARRYICKGNYNTTRMAYIQKLFPDARFVVPIREPVSHVVSLMRQHQRFSEAGRKNHRIPEHMDQVGHFEFGLNRIPVHTGDNARMQQILEAWQQGDDIKGFALYWDMIYRFVYNQLLNHPSLKTSVLVIPYEELCSKPQDTIHDLWSHCRLLENPALTAEKASAIRAPDYYQSTLSAQETAMIHGICEETARLYGYYE